MSEEKRGEAGGAQVGVVLRVLRAVLGKDVKRSDVVTLLTIVGAFGGGGYKADARAAALEARLAAIESAQRETLSTQITQRAEINLLAFRFGLAHPEAGHADPPTLPARYTQPQPAPLPEREAAIPTRVH